MMVSHHCSKMLMIQSLLSLSLSLICVVSCEDSNRNITISYNDGCNITECMGDNGTFYNLVHFTARGSSDDIHYVWSSIGAPTLLLARTTQEAKMKVDWKKLVALDESAIHFEPAEDVNYTSAFLVSRLLEFDDPKDTADITKVWPNMTRTVDISSLMWSNVTIGDANNVTFETEPGTEPAEVNGTFTFQAQVLGTEGRNTILPHLQHLPNTTELTLVLDDLTQHYKHSRFAVELLVIRDQQPGKEPGVTLHQHKSIDDEYTPSIFNTYRLLLDNSTTSRAGSFMLWKPIVYTTDARTTDYAKPAKVYEVNTTNYYVPSYSIAHAYYGNISALDVGAINISFGITKDKFYNATRYYVWSSIAGYGAPPTESLSILIISIISAGLGIPVILLIVGGAYLAVQKRIAKKEEVNGINRNLSINADVPDDVDTT